MSGSGRHSRSSLMDSVTNLIWEGSDDDVTSTFIQMLHNIDVDKTVNDKRILLDKTKWNITTLKHFGYWHNNAKSQTVLYIKDCKLFRSLLWTVLDWILVVRRATLATFAQNVLSPDPAHRSDFRKHSIHYAINCPHGETSQNRFGLFSLVSCQCI